MAVKKHVPLLKKYLICHCSENN